jgi:hypothetical protein
VNQAPDALGKNGLLLIDEFLQLFFNLLISAIPTTITFNVKDDANNESQQNPNS